MNKETTIWIVIAIYAIFMLAVGVIHSKNSSGGMASFTVGGRNAGAWILHCPMELHIFPQLCSSDIPVVPVGIMACMLL